MKRGATKEEIIRATRDLIARNGIRAVRVDEIAQTLGISKRTLYEMFADKNELVGACLDDMSQQHRLRIASCCKRRAGNPLQRTFRLMNEYIDSLYVVESSFLADICRKVTFADRFAEHRKFWSGGLEQALESCRAAQLLLPEIDAATFADRTMSTLLELRLSQVSREELYLFSRTMLCGAASREGIELIDGRR